MSPITVPPSILAPSSPHLPWDTSQRDEGSTLRSSALPGSTARQAGVGAVFYRTAVRAIKQKVNTAKFINPAVKDWNVPVRLLFIEILHPKVLVCPCRKPLRQEGRAGEGKC